MQIVIVLLVAVMLMGHAACSHLSTKTLCITNAQDTIITNTGVPRRQITILIMNGVTASVSMHSKPSITIQSSLCLQLCIC